MNRFWGRNEHGSEPRFSRDDEQILALNYENLCDGDYLNRLFSSDAVSVIAEDSTGDASGMAGSSESGLFSSELPEDFIVYGEDRNLGQGFSKIRFNRQLAASLRSQDAVSTIVNRQAVVFEHISKLMIERCLTPNKPAITNITNSNNSTAKTAPTTVTSTSSAKSGQKNTLNHLAASALDCCLHLLEKQDCRNLEYTTLEPLISMVFQITQEKTLQSRHPNLIVTGFSPGHVEILRNVLSSAAFRCMPATNTNTTHYANNAANNTSASKDEALRTSLASFYGLLALALHTRDVGTLLTAVSHLMFIVLRAEECYEQAKAESKLQLTQSLANNTTNTTNNTASSTNNTNSANNSNNTATPTNSTCTYVVPTTLPATTVAPTKMPPKMKNSDSKKGPGMVQTSATNVVNSSVTGSGVTSSTSITSSVVPAVGVGVSGTSGVSVNSSSSTATLLTVLPSTALITLPTTTTPHTTSTTNATHGTTDTTPSTTNPNTTISNTTHNNSASNMKSWDRVTPKTPELISKHKINNKNIKNEARVIQEILDPNMYTAQELSAYYANNPSTVNYLKVGNNGNNGTSGGSGTNGNNGNQDKVQRKSINKNNNNTDTSGSATYTAGSTQVLILRHKKNIRAYKDNMQDILKIPKPMLKILYDSCISTTADKHTTHNTLLPHTTPTHTTLPTHTTPTHATTHTLPTHPNTTHSSTGTSTYVWTCGQNSYGELGLGDAVMRKSFARVVCLDNKGISSVGAGNEHSLFVTADGKLLTAGYNDNGQCGNGTSAQVRTPTVVAALEGEEIANVHVYNGCEHTLAVTRDGKIFSFGYNYRGQLGLGSTVSEQTPRPIRGLLSRKVVLAACSYHHSIMLCSDGSVYSCGRNDSGQLGHGDVLDKKTPQCITNIASNVCSISCGQFHSVCSTTSGVAYACGKNDYGQLGIENTTIVKLFTPLTVHSECECVVQVCCGYYHTLLLSSSGVVAGFGRNDYGQLGLGHTLSRIYTSTPIVQLRDKNVTTVSAGCYHSIVVTANGMLYVFGRNNHGQLATGDTDERHTPHPVDNFVGSSVISVAAGFYHTIVLTANSTTTTTPVKSVLNTLHDDIHSTHGTGNTGVDLHKDATHLTGIKGSSASSSIIVPFTLERKSRVSSRELLMFLVAHVESLVSTSGTSSNGISGSNSVGSKQWTCNVLCSVTAMLELCCSIHSAHIEDTNSTHSSNNNNTTHTHTTHTTLPLSAEEALTFMMKLVKLTSLVLQDHSSVIISAYETANTATGSNTDSTASGSAAADLHFINDLLNTATSKKTAVNSTYIMSIFEQCMNANTSGDSSSIDNSVCSAVVTLRRKLLTMYFTLTPKDQQHNTKYLTITTDIALNIAHHYTLLLPTPAHIATLYTTLKTYTMPQLTTQVNVYTQSLCVRMLTILCATYRNNDNVVCMFQDNKYEALVVFRCMLCLYGHFSMHSLVKRFHATKPSNTNSNNTSNSNGSVSADVRRLITVLEHCISNFVKCAVPIIFDATSTANNANTTNTNTSTNYTNTSTTSTDNNTNIATYGTQIIREVLTDAIRLVDYILLHTNSEDMLGQLRYGTIMPSILPSILIYGIAFSKYRCVMDVICEVSVLVKKLQLIGKDGVRNTNTNTNTTNTNITSTNNATSTNNTSTNNTSNKSDKKPTVVLQEAHSITGSFRAAVGQLSSTVHAIHSAIEHAAPHTTHSGSTTSTHTHNTTTANTTNTTHNTHTNNTSNTTNTTNNTNTTTSTAIVPYEETELTDAFFEELLLSKRDPAQVSWWFRLIKLCNTFIAKMAAAMVYAPARVMYDSSATSSGGSEGSVYVLTDRQSMIAYHNIFRFVSYTTPTLTLPTHTLHTPHTHTTVPTLPIITTITTHTTHTTHANTLHAYILHTLSQPPASIASEHVVKMCASHREIEKSTDAVYKMLSHSTQAMFSTNLFNLIEETLLQCVVTVCGVSHVGISKTNQYFKLISRFTKRVHSRRSVLVSNSGTTWVEVLVVLCNVVKLFASVVVGGEMKIAHSVALVLPFGRASVSTSNSVSSSTNSSVNNTAHTTHTHTTRTPAQQRWRRAVMLITCVQRWKHCCRLHYSQLATNAIDFVTMACSVVTNNFECVYGASELAGRAVAVYECLASASSESILFSKGVGIVQTLLVDVGSNALRCDVLSVLITAMKDRSDSTVAKFEAHGARVGGSKLTDDEALTLYCTSTALFVHPVSLRALHVQLIDMISCINLNSSSITQHELCLVSNVVKLLQLTVWEGSADTYTAAQYTLPLSTQQTLLLQLRERQCKPVTIDDTNTTSTSVKTKKYSASSVRDRNSAYRRTTHDLLYYLQTTAAMASSSVLHCTTYSVVQLIQLHNHLIHSFQLLRIENMRADAVAEESARSSIDGTTNTSTTSTSTGILINSKQKDNRRRCQDLITKPLEFCRTIEGFVVSSDKLLNSYKGTDYTIASWIMVAKKAVVKPSFITGKLNHNDAWPLVVLRSDSKLDILYGHNNEYEKITSVSSVVQCVWTHIAVIVEAKKIKLFINGVLDCQITTSKGNSRAFLYPLLVGCAPSGFKSKAPAVREGFDGMLAQYKYYSRALQPIHVKIVYDSGPPESTDISAKLIYQLLSSLKCLYTTLHADYVGTLLQESAGLMHLLFVTDTSRRTRFAALRLLTDVLCMGSVHDMMLYPHYSHAYNTQYTNTTSTTTIPSTTTTNNSAPQAVLLSQCAFLTTSTTNTTTTTTTSTSTTFAEKVVLYLITLAGACWSPHVIARLEHSAGIASIVGSEVDILTNNPAFTGSTADSTDISGGNTSSTTTNTTHAMSDNARLAELLRFAPYLMTAHDSLTPQVLSPLSVVDKLTTKKESRHEICNQVIKVLIKLSTVPTYNTALCNVLQRITHYSTLLPGAGLLKLSYIQQLEVVGMSLLVGGGTEGTYIGSSVRTFFSDVSGTILNINKTTNFATLLCYNSQHGHQQIVKVRLSDLIVTPRQDVLQLSVLGNSSSTNSANSVVNSVVTLLSALCEFVFLLLSDYMTTTDSALQRILLKCIRPVEVFVFTQLLHAVVCAGGVSTTTSSNTSTSTLYTTLQQAAIALLKTTPPEALHHLGDNRTTTSTTTTTANTTSNTTSANTTLSQMWHSSAPYLLALPERVKNKQLLGVDEIKTLCECVSKNFNMSTDSILEPSQAVLMKQGRLAELVTLLSLEGVDSTIDVHSDTDGVFVVTDWPPTFPSEWPVVSTDSARNDVHCVSMLALLQHLRKEVVCSARVLLSSSNTVSTITSAGSSDTWARDIIVWQSLLPDYTLDPRTVLHTIHTMIPTHINGTTTTTNTASSWHTKCAYLYTHRRFETTQLLAMSLRYFALTLLQLNVFKSADNTFESVDLFNRTLHTLVQWVEYCDTQSQGEVVSVLLLKMFLPTLSFIDSSSVALQLTQLCMLLVRKLVVRMYTHYTPSTDLLELARGNNFTLLRARAQEQVVKYKTHNMGNVSALAYNLTQLVSGLELVQRLGASASASGSSDSVVETPRNTNTITAATLQTPTKHTSNTTTTNSSTATKAQNVAKIASTETAAPKITGIRYSSIDADLTMCAETVLLLAAHESHTPQDINSPSSGVKNDNVIVEVALGTSSTSTSSVNFNPATDVHYETVYCGASLRFVQSGLAPDCVYYLRCRVYHNNTPLLWSIPVEFKTSKGVLFTFDSMKCGPDIRLREDGLTASYGNDDTWSTVLGTRAFSSGVTHWDIRINSSSTAYVFVGVASSAADLSSFLGGCANGYGFIGEQALYHNREKVKIYGEPFTSGDIVGVTLDLNSGTVSFSRNHKSLGVAFDRVFGELYPAVAFYNVGQELEILVDGFRTTCTFESIPVSPCRLNLDDLSVLNELTLCLYRKHCLSHRLLVLVAEQGNVWCTAAHVRARAVSGRDVMLSTESPLLNRFNLIVGERVRTPYGVAEVAGSAFNKVWFVLNTTGEVWYFTVQQLLDGRAKRMFQRCSYDSGSCGSGSGSSDTNNTTANTSNTDNTNTNTNNTSDVSHLPYDAASVHELIDPTKWSPEMDTLLLTFLSKQADAHKLSDQYKVTAQHVTDNFRALQQQFSRLMIENHDLAYKWGIAGPKRRAVLARMSLLRVLNQYLDMYLPFLVADSSSRAFVLNQPTVTDDFAPVVVSLKNNTTNASNTTSNTTRNTTTTNNTTNTTTLWTPPLTTISAWPLITLSYDTTTTTQSTLSHELQQGPLHAIRSLLFTPMKMAHFYEVLRKTTTRPAKTEDDYDYPDDLPHVKINRLKAFRAREASELLHIPGEDLMLSSMFCQLWRELRQHNDEKLRISYTHPMDDGQSRTFKIKFEGEGVDDYGGPYREIFQQVCEEIQSTDPSAMTGASRPSSWVVGEDKQSNEGSMASIGSIGSVGTNTMPGSLAGSINTGGIASPSRCFLPLLMPTPNWVADGECSERYRYMFHPAAESPLKMDLYHFLGQVVGIAVRSKITLDLALPSYVWKYVVCERLTEHDIASFDAPAYVALQRLSSVHKQLQQLEAQQARGETIDAAALAMLQYNALELVDDLTWAYTRSDGCVLELIPGGGQQRVELSDIGRYLVLYAEARLNEGRNAIGMFRRGLVSIIPESALALLTWDELQAVICGPRTIDVQRLRDNTEYDDDISAEDAHIVLFWDVLSSFSEAEKSAFLRFVWARPTLPPRGVEFTQKMRVLSAVGEDAHLQPDSYLPKAHTCFFSINLPKYSTKELMTEKLLYAIVNCTEMDADFRTTETDVAGWGAAAGVPGATGGGGSGDWQAGAGTANEY